MDYINEHKERFGVEPICKVLTEHGCKIAPSTFYDARGRPPSRRKLRDTELIALIEAERSHKFVALLGARKMWLRLRGKGHDVARCTVERLLREMGVTGVTRAKAPRTTVADEKAVRPQDLVDRQFVANKPNELWCADLQCRRRHCRSYADLRTMPTLLTTRSVGAAVGAGWSA